MVAGGPSGLRLFPSLNQPRVATVRLFARRALDALETKATIVDAVENAAVVGTYTTPNGPGMDDWFLVIVDRSGGTTEVSMDQADDVIRALESRLGTSLALRLNNSTDLASLVSYPPELEGRPMFSFSFCSGFRATFDMIRNFGIRDVEIRLSEDVDRYLQQLR